MNKQNYLLSRLAEEASELAQIALKSQEFGIYSVDPRNGVSNITRLLDELNDLNAIVEMLSEEGVFTYTPDVQSIIDKKERVIEHMSYAHNVGNLDI